jgi:hypothetical protein
MSRPGWLWIFRLVAGVLTTAGTTAHALERVDYLDYGFTTLDNTAGGDVLAGFVSQRIWADTDRRWLGTQLRIELDQGSIFQDTLDGMEFDAEANHAALAALQPSIAFDTRIGVNGQAPGSIMGGAVNLGGTPELRATPTVLDVAFGPGGGNVLSGSFDFGTITLSEDARGRGALLLSSAGFGSDRWESYGFFAHLFEIEQGVIRLTGDPIPLSGRNTDPELNYELTAALEVVSHPKRPHEPPQDDPADEPPPVVDLLPAVPDPDPPTVIPFDPDQPPGGPAGGSHPLGGPPADEDPLISLYELDEPIVIRPADPDGSDVLDLSEYIDPDDWELAPLVLYDEANGEVAVPLSAVVETAVADLVASGNWVLRGTDLVLSRTDSQGGVPEPGSVCLALLTFIAAGFWRVRWTPPLYPTSPSSSTAP